MSTTLQALDRLIKCHDSLAYPNKPHNSPAIDNELIELFNNDASYYAVDIDAIRDGSYFGRQCSIAFSESPIMGTSIELEIAWDNTNIAVYTANHNGYWVAPYTTNKNVLKAWKQFLKKHLFI